MRCVKAIIVLKSLISHTREVVVYSKGNRKPLEGLRCCHLIAMAIPGNQCCLCCCWTVAPLHHWVPKSIFPTSGESKCDWQCWDHTPAWAWALGWGEGKKTDAASLHSGSGSASSGDPWNGEFPQTRKNGVPLHMEGLHVEPLYMQHQDYPTEQVFHGTHFGKCCLKTVFTRTDAKSGMSWRH